MNELFTKAFHADLTGLSPHFHLNSLQIRIKTIHIEEISLSRINSLSFFYHAMISSSFQLDCLHQNVLNVKNHFLKTNYLFVQLSIVVIIQIVFVVIIVIGYLHQAMNIIYMEKIKYSVDKIFNNSIYLIIQ
jgi:hypothetical protein